MLRSILRPLTILSLFLAFTGGCFVGYTQQDPTFETGVKPFGTYDQTNIDSIDLLNQSLSVNIPLISYPQRGGKLKLELALHYANVGNSINSACTATVNGTVCYAVGDFINWQGFVPTDMGAPSLVGSTGSPIYTGTQGSSPYYYSNIVTVQEPDGASHQLFPTSLSDWRSADGSGYDATIAVGANILLASPTTTFKDSEGTQYTPGVAIPGPSNLGVAYSNAQPSKRQDTNGNVITYSASSGWVDTMGRTIPVPVQQSTTADCTGLPLSTVQEWKWALLGPSDPANTSPGNGSYIVYLCYASLTDTLAIPTFGGNGNTPTGWYSKTTTSLHLQGVLLPNQTRWTMQYQANPCGSKYGTDFTPQCNDLQQITYPTGGTVAYQWRTGLDIGRQNVISNARAVTSRTQDPVSSSGSPIVTTYTSPTIGTVTVNVAGNDTQHGFTSYPSNPPLYLETSSIQYQGVKSAGLVLSTHTKTYQPNFSITNINPQGNNVTTSELLSSDTLTWPNQQARKSTYSYDSSTVTFHTNDILNGTTGTFYQDVPVVAGLGIMTSTSDYDYGSGSVGSLLRKTSTPFKFQSTPSFLTNNLMSRLSSKTLYATDGTTPVTYQYYGYDENALTTSGVSSSLHLSTPPGGSTAPRGNLTSIHLQLDVATLATTSCPMAVSASGYVTNNMTYFDTGEVYQDTDACGSGAGDAQHSTVYGYSLTYQGAYPTSMANALGQSTTSTYEFQTGALATRTDANQQLTTYYHTDSFGRLTDRYDPAVSTNNSVKPHTTYSYLDGLGSSIKVTDPVGVVKTTLLDGLGRTIQTQTNSDPVSTTLVDTTYDNMGMVHSVSNPYRSGTTGLVTWTYDALERKNVQTNQDSTTEGWTYTGSTTLFTDEAQIQRQQTVDGLGRMTQVVELGSASNPISLTTNYSYSPTGTLSSVHQLGAAGDVARNRSFTYDSLSRLLCASNPENTSAACPNAATSSYTNNTVGYTYDSSGNVLTKEDARSVKTTYSYDALNRLTGKSYSDGTASAAFGYDGKDASGLTLPANYGASSNVIGRLTYASNSVNADEGFGYDEMGRVITETYCLPVDCGHRKIVSASYDLAGNRTSITYPDTRTVQTGFDAVGRIKFVQYQNWNTTAMNQTYLTAGATNSYDPAGHLINATFGNGVPYSAGYDNRERMTGLAYGQGAAPVWSKQYAWTASSNLQSQTDLITGVQRQFTYDSLNRLAAAQDIFSNAAIASGSNGGTTSTGSSGSGAEEAPGVSGALPEWTNPDDSNLLPELKAPNTSWTVVAGSTAFNTVMAAPDGVPPTLAFAAASGSTDSYIEASPSKPADYSLETMTGSVWLKSVTGAAMTVNLYLTASGASIGTKQVQVTSAWTQYQVTAAAPNNVTAMTFRIGGGGSVTSGQSFYIWNPMLEDEGIAGTSVTNFLPYSQRVTATTWGLNALATDNAAPAPDGTNTAASVTSTGSDAFITDTVRNPAPYTGQSITGSVWLRSPSGTQSLLLTLLEDGNVPAGAITVNLTSAWQRFQVSGNNSNTLNELALQIGGASTFTNGQIIQVWGAQMELASSAGPYVATAATPVTASTNLTNILQYSQQPNGSSWSGTVAFPGTINTVIAPDGSKTGYQATAQGGSGWLTNDVSNVALYNRATVTASVYLRVPSGTGSINFYLIAENQSGRVLLQQVPASLTTNWQRFATTAQLPNGLTRLLIQIGETETAGQVVDVWGSQLELSNHAGPYIATSALPIIAGSDPTNILPNSQNLSGANWSMAVGGCTVNAVAAPDGTGTAANCVSQATSTDSYLKVSVPNPSLYDNEQVTVSVYLRSTATSGQSIMLYLQNSGASGFLAAAQASVSVPTTWKRFDLTATLQNGLTYLALQIGGAGSLKAGQNIQIWGAQFVIGSAPAPYTSSNPFTTVYATGTAGTLVPNGLNQVYSYDSFGNILQNGSFESSYTAKNQMFGYAYDAAGNVLSDGMNIMTWDAESRMATASGATYIYDAEGNRVEKQGSGITDTVYFGGQPIARYSAGQWTDLIYGPTGLLAEVPGTQTGAPVYRVIDNLGTNVGSLLATGAFVNPVDHMPFGQVFTGNTNDPYLFTGKERDAESGLDYFRARYYGSNMGRFMSPDWAAGAEAVPYAEFDNPQSLNLYTYVSNNPLSRRDVDGHHQECAPDWVSVDKNSVVTVNAGACHEVHDPAPFFAFAIGLGHHFIPRQLIKTWDPKSYAARLANQLTTGSLKDKTANYNDVLQRSNNSKVIKIVRDYMQANGKNAGELVKADFDAIVEKVSTAGGDIEAFNDRLQTTNPGVRTAEDALAHAAQLVGAGVEEVEEACGGTCPIP